MITLHHAPRRSLMAMLIEQRIQEGHYLRCLPDMRTSFESYVVRLDTRMAGALVFGRPEATRCGDWYGSVADTRAGRCAVTRWQVLNLSRIWLDPAYQGGGRFCRPEHVPGFHDRHGVWRPALASAVLEAAARFIGADYLLRRPPCFLDEPYEIRWLLSYCDLARHRATIYRAAGWELYRTNERGMQTWRTPLPPLTPMQDAAVRAAALSHPRSIRYRARRQQLELELKVLRATGG